MKVMTDTIIIWFAPNARKWWKFEECFPEKIEAQIASKNGFKSVTHKLEFFGICPDCQR